jgi:hypothetical protein
VAGQLAEDLSQGDADAFLAHFDRAMPGYARLRDAIAALANLDTVSSIDVLEDKGDDKRRVATLDWILSPAKGKRRATVTITIERRGKRWTIVALAPLEFFDPPQS